VAPHLVCNVFDTAFQPMGEHHGMKHTPGSVCA
jgi:hypothetical protein